MHVLVTGGAGFIGSHIVDLLLASGYRVTVVDDLSTGRPDNVNPAATLVELDIRDRAMNELCGAQGFEAVIHQAAQPSVPRSLEEPLLDCHVNVLGTVILLEACRRHGIQRFVFASSAAVYGDPAKLPIAEESPTLPLSPYGLAKLAAEGYLRLYRRLYGLETVALRYANVYGPRQDAVGEAAVVSLFAQQTLRGQQPVIHGDGLQTRDFIFVSDVARANLLALEPSVSPGVYNVGTGIATTIVELFDRISEGRLPRQHAAARPGDVHHSVLDAAAFRRAAGWQPLVTLDEGLERTRQAFAANRVS